MFASTLTGEEADNPAPAAPTTHGSADRWALESAIQWDTAGQYEEYS
jgi:hypothetical protein